MVIWKFELDSPGEVKVEMPQGAKALSVHTIDGKPYLWALVDPASPRVVRTFKVVPTGSSTDGAGRFLGTFFLGLLPFVFHAFDPEEAAMVER